MKGSLESILTCHDLTKSTHDNLIRRTIKRNEHKNYFTIAYSGAYKLRKGSKLWQSDMDLLQASAPSVYDWATDYRDIPSSKLLLHVYEMKSNDSIKNYNKMLGQLAKHVDVLMKFSVYNNIKTYYVYGVGKGFNIEEIILR